MGVSDSARPLPPLSSPPMRTSITSDAPRSGFAPADVPRFDTDATEAFERAPGGFAPESAVDEQIADLERWALANVARDRKDKLRFWVLRGVAFLGAAGAAVASGLGAPQLTLGLSLFAALSIAVDAAWPTGTFRNPHQRAVHRPSRSPRRRAARQAASRRA